MVAGLRHGSRELQVMETVDVNCEISAFGALYQKEGLNIPILYRN